MPDFDEVAEVEQRSAMEVHLGEVSLTSGPDEHYYERLCIIWINGKRWQGHLKETEDGE